MKLTRDFTATAFVYWQGKVLLHRHKKIDMWLPTGGHIEANELPDEAAIRETLEESGVLIVLVADAVLPELQNAPTQLVRPRGIQLEPIIQNAEEKHEHIDLIYFARPVQGYAGYLLENDSSLGWYSPTELAAMDISSEIQHWCALLFKEMGEKEMGERKKYAPDGI